MRGDASPSHSQPFTADLRRMRHAEGCRGAFPPEACGCGLRRARWILKRTGNRKDVVKMAADLAHRLLVGDPAVSLAEVAELRRLAEEEIAKGEE